MFKGDELFKNDKKRHEDACQSREQCACKSTEGLFVPNRQLSLIVSSIILINFCVFIGGYFLGQKKSVERFVNKVEQDSFADQIYSSMCAIGETVVETENDVASESSDGDEAIKRNEETRMQVASEESISETSDRQDANPPVQVVKNLTETPTVEHYAQLIGFGSARSAQLFVERLQKRDMPVFVKKRQSRTAKGRLISWYQVVTEKFTDKAELLSVVNKLKHEEKLNDVRIITC